MSLQELTTTMPRHATTPTPPRTATTQPRRIYEDDLTDAQWAILEPLLPPAPGGGRPRTTLMREVLNAILYLLRTGSAWKHLPHDFPPSGTVYDYFKQWRREGFSQLDLGLAIRANNNRVSHG